MLMRGLKILFTLPLLTVLLAGSGWLLANGDFFRGQQMVTAQPDQQVAQFLDAVTNGDILAARQHVSPFAPRVNLALAGMRFEQNYGPIVMNAAEIRSWNPYRAIVWSRTRTASGHTCLMQWTLRRENDRWLITKFGQMARM